MGCFKLGFPWLYHLLGSSAQNFRLIMKTPGFNALLCHRFPMTLGKSFLLGTVGMVLPRKVC